MNSSLEKLTTNHPKQHGDSDMWKVQYKPNNASQVWQNLGSYGNEQSALSNASRIVGRYFMVGVIDPNGSAVFSG